MLALFILFGNYNVTSNYHCIHKLASGILCSKLSNPTDTLNSLTLVEIITGGVLA